MVEPDKQYKIKLPDSVLIVGCGYIGSALAERLLAAGVRVGALTRNCKTADALRKLGLAEVVVADLDSHEWHKQINSQYQGVVNCVSSAGGGLIGYQKSYVEGQKSLLAWARQKKPEIICYTSSTSVYPQDHGDWVDETAATEPASETSAILVESERILLEDALWRGRRYILRLGGIYGPGRHYLIDQVKEGATVLPGMGQYHLNMIHRDDAVGGILAVLDRSALVPDGVYNLCDGQPSKKMDIVSWIAAQMKLPCPSFDPKLASSRVQRRGGKMPDRKISNHKLQVATCWQPIYSSFKSGYLKLL
jgi:nucleoside-diphosphate-sugar epimerase